MIIWSEATCMLYELTIVIHKNNDVTMVQHTWMHLTGANQKFILVDKLAELLDCFG